MFSQAIGSGHECFHCPDRSARHDRFNPTATHALLCVTRANIRPQNRPRGPHSEGIKPRHNKNAPESMTTTRSLENTKIGMIGLGYVGLPLAVELGKHFDTIGFDINRKRIEELRAGHDRSLECSAEELRASPRLSYTDQASDLADCTFFIVTVPTPIDQHKRPDLTPLIKASETVGKVLKRGDIVVYESTVYPGATEEVCVPILEAQSGLKYNEDFFCGYSPERINPGDKEHRVRNTAWSTSRR